MQLKHSSNHCIFTGIGPLIMRQTRGFKLSICVVMWLFIFVFILHLAKEYLLPVANRWPPSFMAIPPM